MLVSPGGRFSTRATVALSPARWLPNRAAPFPGPAAPAGPAIRPAAGQKKWKSGWPLCQTSMITRPTIVEPLIGPQKRLSQEIARLSPIM
jgi:hypothetical protein